MDADFRRAVGIRDLEAGRQRGDVLERRGRAARGIIGAGRTRAVDFIQDVEEFSVGGELRMSRTGSRWYGDERRIIRSQSRAGGVKAETEDAVESQVGHEGETVVRRDGHGVGVRL